jgi:hypothetical protein
MSLQLRSGSGEQRLGTVRISPEILSAFNKAIESSGHPQTNFGFQTQLAAVPEPGILASLAAGAGRLISPRRPRARV